MSENQLIETSIKSLPLLHKGKVRDIYEVDDKHLLIITTDRLSAFDVVMSEPIPFKGFVLTQMANFWFNKLSYVVANHLSGSFESLGTDCLSRSAAVAAAERPVGSASG